MFLKKDAAGAVWGVGLDRFHGEIVGLNPA
jgi:hypothetical protein